MFNRVMATVIFVHDLARCKAFYRDTLGLQEQESDANSVSFQMENVYFLLLEASAAAQMVSEQALELKFEGGPRGLLAAGVEDVNAAYETLKARGGQHHGIINLTPTPDLFRPMKANGLVL